MTHVCAVADEDIKRIADLEVISALQFLWMYRDPLCELEIATSEKSARWPCTRSRTCWKPAAS